MGNTFADSTQRSAPEPDASPQDWPALQTWNDVLLKGVEIEAFVKKFPTHDKIYHLDTLDEEPKRTCHGPSTVVVAGSAALQLALDMVGRTLLPSSRTAWSCNDTDVFVLGCAHAARRKMPRGIDLVHVTDSTVDDLLLGFDLPCCRVATDTTKRWWVSLQCLNAMLTGRFPLPLYLKEATPFRRTLLSVQGPGAGALAGSQTAIDAWCTLLFERLQKRISKYQLRDFRVDWFETPVVVSWLCKQSCYVESSIAKNGCPARATIDVPHAEGKTA